MGRDTHPDTYPIVCAFESNVTYTLTRGEVFTPLG